MINYNHIESIVPKQVFDELLEVTTKYKINSRLRLAHFLAQCSHESSNFTRVSENLNYSADGLLKVFPKYFDAVSAKEYEHNAMKIASRVYANRMGNESEESCMGWLYRGRGYMQLTGCENYREFNKTVSDNLILNPELVATKYPLLSAAWFWDKKSLNDLADNNEIETITKRINGGMNGFVDRKDKFDKFYGALHV